MKSINEYSQVRKISLLLTTVIALCSCHQDSQRIVGIKIYDYQGDVQALVNKWKDIGINTAFISVDLASNAEFRQTLRRNAIPAYIIFPVFFNPQKLASDSSLFAITDRGQIAKDEWVQFACPSRKDYRADQISAVRSLVSNVHPEGISLDFIRHFVYWEKIYEDRLPETIARACYCDHCLSDFSTKTGAKVPDTLSSVQEKAMHLSKYHEAAWNDYRTDLIASLVEEISSEVKRIDSRIRVCIHAVPWREADFGGAAINVAGQDLDKLADFADFVSPMCYSAMLQRPPEWISSVANDLDKRAPGRILPSIQVYDTADSVNYDRDKFRLCIREALATPSRGVVFWSWPQFALDSMRMDIAKAAIPR